MAIADANDAMIRRLERELDERLSAQQGLIANANDAGRDLNDAEKETLAGIQRRMGELKEQLELLDATSKTAIATGERLKQIDVAVTQSRRVAAREVEYRSAGSWMADHIAASTGSKSAMERLEVFHRTVAHQLTDDNPGVIPDPVVGNVLDFIDAARPLINSVGVQALPAATFYRPKVTQHTAVARQTDEGSPEITEKVELESQKMTITRLTVNTDTYGGYVNVSRQNIDFSSPQILDLIVNSLASQYAIETEAAFADALASVNTPAVEYPDPDGQNFTEMKVRKSIWSAASDVWTAVKGQGRVVLAVAPDRLEIFGPLFTPLTNPAGGTASSSGFAAGRFGQGVMGQIDGIPVVMSAGLGSGEAFLFSTAAIEAWEQRVGTLQVVEPSVLGVQIAYAGYFASLVVQAGGIVPLEEGTF